MNLLFVDSDVLIDSLRGNEGAREFLEGTARTQTAACSAINVAEILAGVRPGERHRADALVAALDVHDVTVSIGRIAGELKRIVGRRTGASLDDMLIAATAMASKAPLATRNVKHFRVPGLEVVRPGY